MQSRIRINGWAGGINRALPAEDIQDYELVEAVNLELTQTNALSTRYGVTPVDDSTSPFTDPVTSIHYYEDSSGNKTVIYTTLDEIHKSSPAAAGSGTFTDITGSLTPTSGAKWSWVTFDDKALGCSTAGDLAILATTGAASATAWTASAGSLPSSPSLLTVWNRRVVLVDGNDLYLSALGDHTDWDTTVGIAGATIVPVGHDEGAAITGVHVFRDRLIVFKKDRIYVVVPGSPNTDTSQWEVRLLTDRIGCLSHWTIQPVLQDLVFLSHYGLASLAAVEQLGELREALLSLNLPDLVDIDKSDPDAYASVINAERSQYWLAVPTTVGSTDNDRVFVMHFGKPPLADGLPQYPWTEFDGGTVGVCYGVVEYEGRPRVHIGGFTDAYVYDTDTHEDTVPTDYLPTERRARTRAFVMDEPFLRKQFYRWGAEFQSLTSTVDWQITARLDQTDQRLLVYTGQLSGTLTGAKWDEDLWDVGYWATEVGENADVIRIFRGNAGTRAQSVQFVAQNDDFSQGYLLKRMMVVFEPLPSVLFVGDG